MKIARAKFHTPTELKAILYQEEMKLKATGKEPRASCEETYNDIFQPIC
jgi:hypothetical protein